MFILYKLSIWIFASRFKDGALKREKSVSGSELSGSQESHSSQHDESHDKIHSDITTSSK